MTRFYHNNGVITRHDGESTQSINIDELIAYINDKECSIDSLSNRAQKLYNFKGESNVKKV